MKIFLYTVAVVSLADLAAAQSRSFESALSETGRVIKALRGHELPVDEIPASLPGEWKISLCIDSSQHAWLRYQSLDNKHVVTLSRFQSLAGGDFDWKRLSYRRKPVLKAGLWMNRELGAEGRVRSGRHIMISTIVRDPVIFRGRSQGRGHGNVVNNCATWCRDAWEFYSGERYEFNGLHTPILLRNAVIRRHPEVLKDGALN